jgi:hypothetical protein
MKKNRWLAGFFICLKLDQEPGSVRDQNFAHGIMRFFIARSLCFEAH